MERKEGLTEGIRSSTIESKNEVLLKIHLINYLPLFEGIYVLQD
jgi:hypothetical protein